MPKLFIKYLLTVSLLLLFGCGIFKEREQPKVTPFVLSGNYRSYLESVKPILDKRCVVCHSCNDAPCQLDHTSYEGTMRGASSQDIYTDRLFSAEPTRLGIDAKSVGEWRDKGFFSVVKNYRPGDEKNLSHSILYQLIAARLAVPDPGIKYDSFSSRSCPNLEAALPKLENALTGLFRDHPNAALGMPYGFPPLNPREFAIIRDWLILGAPGPESKTTGDSHSEKQANEIQKWENFLNGGSPREKLVSRYLYEHLYYAHLYFKGHGSGQPEYYRLVRSRTSAPDPIDEIATRFPTSYPGSGDFYYRLRPVERTIVHKTHLPYLLGEERMQRFRQLFFADNWTLDDLPGYEAENSANPFVTFLAIPAKARYQFMLDDAEYFVENFMKGPVCRGQLALNVINDHFFLFFIDPDADISVNNPEYLAKTAKYLITPFRPEDSLSGEQGSKLWHILELPKRALSQLRRSFYPFFKSRQLRYLKARDGFLGDRQFRLEDIWDGDGGRNKNAVLTVFRHFDSASVTHGAVGGTPKTSLVLDYPIFERMYYNLVANFDIFGDIKLQLATRLYMDDLRIEGEDLFLSFLPLEDRIPARNYWYRGAEDSINSANFPFYGTNQGFRRESSVVFSSKPASPQELVSIILRNRTPHSDFDGINSKRYGGYVDGEIGPIVDKQSLEAELRKLGGGRGEYLQALPPVSLVRFRPADGRGDLVYSFIHVHGHLNVKYLFNENERLTPEEDRLLILPNYQGSYPNFFFDVKISEAQDFLTQLTRARKNDETFSKLVDRFGVRRLDPRFWEHADWFNQNFMELNAVEGAILDLGRYENF